MLKEISKTISSLEKNVINAEAAYMKKIGMVSNDNELAEYLNYVFERLEREKILRWLADSIRESLDLNEILKNAVEKVGKLLKVDRCLISIYDPKSSKFSLHNEYKREENIKSVLNSFPVQNLSDEWQNFLTSKKLPIIINDLNSDLLNEKQREYFRLNDVKSLIVIPLVFKDELLGSLTVHKVSLQKIWEVNHIEMLKDIASQIAIAINQAELYAKTKRQAERELLLRKLSESIRSTLDIEEIFKIICEELVGLFNVERCRIVEFTDKYKYKDWILRKEFLSNDSLVSSEQLHNSEIFLKTASYWGKIIFEEANTIKIDDIENSDSPESFRKCYDSINAKSIISIPIKKGAQYLGNNRFNEI